MPVTHWSVDRPQPQTEGILHPCASLSGKGPCSIAGKTSPQILDLEVEFEGWDDLIKVNEPSPSTLPGMGLESPSSYFINHPVENGYILVGPNTNQLGTQLDVLSCLSRPSQNEYLNPNGPNTNDVVIKPILNPLGNNPLGDAFNPSQNSLQANSRPKIHPNQRHTQNYRFLSKCSLW